MAKAKNFTVTIEDKPGALRQMLPLALAERGVNILAFNRMSKGQSLVRILVDNPASAIAVLGGLHMIFEETDVAIIRVAHAQVSWAA